MNTQNENQPNKKGDCVAIHVESKIQSVKMNFVIYSHWKQENDADAE